MEQWWRSQLRRDDGAVDDGWQASGRRRQWVTDCITQITPTYWKRDAKTPWPGVVLWSRPSMLC